MNPLIERVLSRMPKPHTVRRSGDTGRQWEACCPTHEDSKQSLAIGEGHDGKVLIKCYVGCSIDAILGHLGLSLGDLFEDGETKKEPVTVALLAWDKRLPLEFLEGPCGLKNNPDRQSVSIPYFGEGGERLFARRRTSLRAKDGSLQPAGVKLQPYGLWRLGDARSRNLPLIMVEGESDCWTLWHHGFAALGIPGGDCVGSLTAEHAKGIAEIFVCREPGETGSKFPGKVAARLAELGWTGKIRSFSLGAIKDPNGLHQRSPADFGDEMRKAMEGAEAVLAPAPSNGRAKDFPANGQSKKRAPMIPGVVSDKGPEPVAPPPAPGYYALTDWGNAQRLAFRHGRDLRFVGEWKKWLVWDGRVWCQKVDHLVEVRAKDTVRAIYAEAAAAEAADMRARIGQHATHSESARSIAAMIHLARSEAIVPTDMNILDSDPWLLNCANGTVDLRTGELRPHRRDDLITKMTPTPFLATAPCPLWEKFLSDIFEGNAELIAYVRRLLGYCCTGDTSSHILPVFWGGGGNGKGTLLNTLHRVFGKDYACAASTELLMARSHDRHPTEIAHLLGKRLVVCQETEDGCRLNEPLVKWLTGGDKLMARRMREDPWEFDPTHKLILSTNYRPAVRGTDKGIWRRLRLIPFTVTFEGPDADTKLPDRLAEEAPGILAWCVRGCLEWLRDGEKVPAAVFAATTEYKKDEDIVFRFLTDACRRGDDLRTRASTLYEAFVAWIDTVGERNRRISQKAFGSRLSDMGFQRLRNDGMVYVGVGLKAPGQAVENEESPPKNEEFSAQSEGFSHNGKKNSGPLDLSRYDL